MEHLDSQHKTLNIIHAQNVQLYTTTLKHNNYISVFSSSLKEKVCASIFLNVNIK